MKRLLCPFLLRIVIFLIILLVCKLIYNRLPQDYTADISFDIRYDSRILFEESGIGLYYGGKGADSLRYGLNYKMDSLEWLALKASGKDMRIKDAIVIRSNLKPVPEYEHSALPLWRVDTDGNSPDTYAVHFDMDFTNSPGCYLAAVFRGNIFGNNSRSFGVKLSYSCWGNPMKLGENPNDLTIDIPPYIQIQTTPQYTDRNPDQVEFSKEDLNHLFTDGIYIEGHNPRIAKEYDNWIFFLGAILGALMSWLVVIFDNIILLIMKKMRRKKTVVAEGNMDDRSVAGVVENNLPVPESGSELEAEETPVSSNE